MSRTFTLRRVRIWDGRSESYLDADSIEISGRSIVAIGGDPASPPLDRDCAGLTALPGLIDAHVHLSLDPDATGTPGAQTRDDTLREAMSLRASAMLRAGITTARDLGGGTFLEL